MKTFYLFHGYDSDELVVSCKAKSHAEAANYFRRFLKEKLAKDSLYGYCIKDSEFNL